MQGGEGGVLGEQAAARSAVPHGGLSAQLLRPRRCSDSLRRLAQCMSLKGETCWEIAGGIAWRHPIDDVIFNYKCGDFCKMRDDEERKEGHGDDKASEGGP